MSIESVRVSEKAKSQLIKLKAKTGINQWNTLCRWAFCLSLKESTIPPDEEIITDSNIEMTWKTFGGSHHDLYLSLLKTRLNHDGLEVNVENTKKYFKLHLHRGISYLQKSTNTLTDLFV